MKGHRVFVRQSEALQEIQVGHFGIMDEMSRLPETVKCVAIVAHTEGLAETLKALSPGAKVSFKLGMAVVLRLPTSDWTEVPNIRNAKVVHTCVPTGRAHATAPV